MRCSDKKNYLACHNKLTFLADDLVIDYIYWFNIIVPLHVSQKHETKKVQWVDLEILLCHKKKKKTTGEKKEIRRHFSNASFYLHYLRDNYNQKNMVTLL